MVDAHQIKIHRSVAAVERSECAASVRAELGAAVNESSCVTRGDHR